MTNHIHLVFKSVEMQKPELLLQSKLHETTRKDSCGSVGENFNWNQSLQFRSNKNNNFNPKVKKHGKFK